MIPGTNWEAWQFGWCKFFIESITINSFNCKKNYLYTSFDKTKLQIRITCTIILAYVTTLFANFILNAHAQGFGSGSGRILWFAWIHIRIQFSNFSGSLGWLLQNMTGQSQTGSATLIMLMWLLLEEKIFYIDSKVYFSIEYLLKKTVR